MPSRPVRPRDAASLILTRRQGGALEVLMGRRAHGHAFMPHFYVYPGGRLDAQDLGVAPAAPLRPAVSAKLARSCRPRHGQGLALAAVRETWEETGLRLGRPGPSPSLPAPGWRSFAADGLAPALDGLDYVGRAITPPDAPIRFHNRFFLASGDLLRGELGGSGELLDLGWRTVEDCLALGLADVTEFMLHEAVNLLASPAPDGHRPPLFGYRRGRAHVRFD
jgi:8-oxo-dGTP pyrophosphatase MutT (NUDIX family)